MNQLAKLILLISVAIFVGFSECRRIIWKQRTNIGDARNWVGDKVPCSSDTLLFPQQNYDLIKLSNFSMKEIILPKTGAFILDTQTSLNFHETDTKCKANEIKSFKSVIQTPWLSTNNWLSARDVNQNGVINDDENNAATPHEERVPCDNDEIIFPQNNSFVVDLQSVPILSFKSIAIDGRILSMNEFKDFLFSTFGQSAFKNTDNTLFIESSCNDATENCVCHQKNDALMEQLCENEISNCQMTPPHCSDPIKPIGHCCPECGALFHMKLDSDVNFNLPIFKTNLAKAINATSAVDPNKIVYHISVTVASDTQRYLQLVIVDRYQYNQFSTKLMDFLKRNFLNQIYKKESKFYFISGMPLTPNESGHVFAFIFGTFFIVTMFMTLIYIVYYDERHIPRIMAMIRNHRFLRQSDVIFARFDNTRASGREECEGSLAEVDLHFGTDQSIENVNSAFNNPMFDQNTPEHNKESDKNDDGNNDMKMSTIG